MGPQDKYFNVKSAAGGGGGAVRSSEPYNSGQTTVYITGDTASVNMGNGVDFYTLSENNPHGNAYRFTDMLGNDWKTGTPVGDHIVDWSTADYVNETVVVWWKGLIALTTWTLMIPIAIVDQGSSGYASGWALPNGEVSWRVCEGETGALPTFFTTNISDFWTGDDVGTGAGLQAIYCKRGQQLVLRTKTSTEQGRQVRLYTFTEAGA